MIYFCLPSPDSLPSQDRQNDVVLLASKWDFDIMAGKPNSIFTSCGMTLGARSAKKGCAQIHPWKPTCEKSLSNYKGQTQPHFLVLFLVVYFVVTVTGRGEDQMCGHICGAHGKPSWIFIQTTCFLVIISYIKNRCENQV